MKKKECLSNWGAEKKPTGCGCTNWHLAAAVALIIGTRFSGGAKINAVLCWHILLIGFVSDAPALCKLKQPNLDRVWLKCFLRVLQTEVAFIQKTHTCTALSISFFHIHTLEGNTKQEENPWSFSCWLKSPEPQGLLPQFPGAPCEWLLPLFPPSSSTCPVCIALILHCPQDYILQDPLVIRYTRHIQWFVIHKVQCTTNTCLQQSCHVNIASAAFPFLSISCHPAYCTADTSKMSSNAKKLLIQRVTLTMQHTQFTLRIPIICPLICGLRYDSKIDMSTTESSVAGFGIDMLVDKPSFSLTRANLFTNY